MKPKNMPARKDARRRAALARGLHSGAHAERDANLTALALRSGARSVCSKKRRGGLPTYVTGG